MTCSVAKNKQTKIINIGYKVEEDKIITISLPASRVTFISFNPKLLDNSHRVGPQTKKVGDKNPSEQKGLPSQSNNATSEKGSGVEPIRALVPKAVQLLLPALLPTSCAALENLLNNSVP